VIDIENRRPQAVRGDRPVVEAGPESARSPSSSVAKLPLLLLVPSLLAAALSLLPLGYLVRRATEQGWPVVVELLWRQRTLELLGRSLLLAATVTLACAVVGVALAWLIVRTDLPFRRAWAVVAALPLAVPSYVAAFSWLAVDSGFEGFWAAALVLTLCSYPYVYLPVAAALQRIDPALEEISRSQGMSAFATFARVQVPQLRFAATSGALLVATYTLSEFGAVSLLRYDTVTRGIYTSYRASFDRTPAAVYGCLLAAVTALIVFAEYRARGRGRYFSDAPSRRPVTLQLRRWRWVAVCLPVAIAGLALTVPALATLYWSAKGSSSAVWSEVGTAGWTSLRFALYAGMACAFFAVPLGVLAARYRSWLAGLIEQITWVVHSLPGLVIALALVFFGIRLASPIYQETPLLVIAYVALFLPLAVGAVRASVAQSSPELEEAARSLGDSARTSLRRVTLPLALPGIGAGSALVILATIKELPATILLRPTGSDTLATQLWTATSVGRFAEAAPYAAALVVVAAIPTMAISRWSRSTSTLEHVR